MQTVSLGGSPLKVSRLAYGCWRIAAPGVDGPRAIRAAVEAGFTLFDHADIYGGGVCEEVFGGVMKESPELRHRLFIASKCGIRLPHLWRRRLHLRHVRRSHGDAEWAALHNPPLHPCREWTFRKIDLDAGSRNDGTRDEGEYAIEP